MPNIHKTALVDPKAKISDLAIVGPYSIVGPDVTIGDGTILEHHVNIQGNTTIGKNNKISPFVSLGTEPQDLKYNGEKTKLIIGDNNTIREYVTMNIGTDGGGGITRIGNHNLIMAYCHVAHDCQLGDHIVLVNSLHIAGHVVIEDYAVVGGIGIIVQFLNVGKHAYIATPAIIRQNVPPFFKAKGTDKFVVQGVNSIGLKRRGFTNEEILALKKAYKLIYKSKLVLSEIFVELDKLAKSYTGNTRKNLEYLLDFIKKNQEKGISKN